MHGYLSLLAREQAASEDAVTKRKGRLEEEGKEEGELWRRGKGDWMMRERCIMCF